MHPPRLIMTIGLVLLGCAAVRAAEPPAPVDLEWERAKAAAAGDTTGEPVPAVSTQTTQVKTKTQLPPQAQTQVLAPVTTTRHDVVVEEKPQGPHYELIMQNERGRKNTRVPALILDTYRGIVWTCQNIQDGRPLWVKTDLGQHGNTPMTKKRYISKMLERQEGALRVPALVLDTEEGVVWNCPNIIDANATWIRKNLVDLVETAVR
jgi:hypothetical protein